MNSFPETDVGSLDPKNRKQIISMARRLLRTDNVGMLVDGRGLPQARWMATMSFDDFPDLYLNLGQESRSRPGPSAPESI